MRITEQYDLRTTRSGEPIMYVRTYVYAQVKCILLLDIIHTYIHKYTHVPFKHSNIKSGLFVTSIKAY